MTAYSVGGTGVTFEAIDMSFSDKSGSGGLEEITCTCMFDNAGDWGAFFSLRSWNISVRAVPGGQKVYVDVLGGAGAGSLSIDNLDSHSAILTGITRDFVEPGTLRSKAVCTWLVVG